MTKIEIECLIGKKMTKIEIECLIKNTSKNSQKN